MRRPPAELGLAALGLAGILAIVVSYTALVAWRREAPPPDPELEALKALAPYEPWAQVNDQGKVVRLRLEGKRADDAALDLIPAFKHLYSLSLAYAPVTDDGVARLGELETLTELGLVGTQVTDRGLATLAKVPGLRRVWVRRTDGLTRTGIDALCRAAPDLVVYDDNVPRTAAAAKQREKGR